MGHVTGLIYTLDLGVAAGFAKGKPGDMPVSGTVRLKKPSQSIDVAFANLIAFLCQEFEQEKPQLVIKEKMLHLQALSSMGNGQANVIAQAKYHGIVEGLCVRFGIPWDEVADSTARKHFIGIGRAGSREEVKAAVVSRCHVLKLMPKDCVDDNRADALAIHDWACANFGSRAASISNFQLFEQVGRGRG
jgi:Holliday junction resolvasome RuvABC endonuclease subunit